MINIANMGVKAYKFKDGDKEITTNNPTQDIYMQMSAGMNGAESIHLVSTVMEHMLKPEDKHYLQELDFTTELMLVQDYFQFHSSQLEARFPDTNTTGQ